MYVLVTAGDVAGDLVVDAAWFYDNRVSGVRQHFLSAPVQADPVVDHRGVAASLPQRHTVADVSANSILLRLLRSGARTADDVERGVSPNVDAAPLVRKGS